VGRVRVRLLGGLRGIWWLSAALVRAAATMIRLSDVLRTPCIKG
jgi:hypothetical protein